MSAVEWSHDFETRSACDLRTAGMYRYFEDPSTDALCLAWRASPELPGGLWKRGDAPPADLCNHIEAGGVLRGWNVGFERQCFEKIMGPRYGWPVPKLEQFVCTAAEAGAMALPRRLENCAPVLGLEQRKDMDGSKAMKKLCKPRKTWTPDMPGYDKAHAAAILDDVKYTILGLTIVEWWADKALFDQLYPYCEQDVLVEMLISRKVRRLSDSERALFLLDQRINDRGITVDLPLVRASMDMAATATKRLNNDMAAATGWQVTAATKAKSIIEWISAQGVEVDSVKKSAVRDLLARDDLPAAVREVAELRKEAAKSSTAKLKAFVKAAGSDSKVRGLLMYCGANTGRWCLAEGSLVLVKDQDGYVYEKAIESVTLDDLVWDGNNWVRHEGVVFSGEKDVIEHDGVLATPAHNVYVSTTEYMTLGEAAERGIPLYASPPEEDDYARVLDKVPKR